MAKVYSKGDLEKKLAELSGWRLTSKDTVLSKTFETSNFLGGISFAAKIAVHAEVLGHHPDLEISYKQVIVHLSTHDAGGITSKDFELARRIDGLL